MDISTRAHFLKQSHKLSHPNTQDECVCVCVCVFARARVCLCYCVESEQPPSASVYGQGTLTRHPRTDSGSIKSSGCAALWAQQRLQGRFKSGLTSPPRQSQYLWIKHDASRMRLQERSRTCEAEDARAFAVQRANFPVSADTSIPGKPHLKP